MTIAQKDRLRARRQKAQGAPPVVEMPKRPRGRPPKVSRPDRITVAGVDPSGPVQAFFDQFAVEQAARRRKYNDAGNDRTAGLSLGGAPGDSSQRKVAARCRLPGRVGATFLGVRRGTFYLGKTGPILLGPDRT
jgi:hypothetical protein